MDKNYKIIFKSGKLELEISPESKCKLIAGGLAGFDCAGFDVRIKSYASRNGGYAESRRFTERELALNFEIAAHGSEAEELRRRIITMMNPALDCEIDAEIYGVHRKITVIPCGEAVFVRETMYDRVEVSLEFVAPSVFFRAAEPTTIIFREQVPLLTFPMSFMKGAGIAAGLLKNAHNVSLTNTGDAECGVVVSICANGGSIVNPVIRCGEDFVKCPLTLSDGDVLVIDTRDRHKNIYLNGQRYFSFDRRSKFFSLPTGLSTVALTCDSGEEYFSAFLEYVPLYFGV